MLYYIIIFTYMCAWVYRGQNIACAIVPLSLSSLVFETRSPLRIYLHPTRYVDMDKPCTLHEPISLDLRS